MPLADIKNQILSESEEEKQKIIAEAEKKVRQTMADILKRKDVLESESKTSTQKLLEKAEQRHASVLNREMRVKKDALKREILDNIFKRALEKLNSASEDAYQKFAKKALESLSRQMEAEIIVPLGKAAFFKKVVSDFPKLSIKESPKIKGGFLISGRDFGYDLTFESVLQKERAALELELSKILFS